MHSTSAENLAEKQARTHTRMLLARRQALTVCSQDALNFWNEIKGACTHPAPVLTAGIPLWGLFFQKV